MKGIYWRPRRISRLALLLITVIALGGFYCVERFPTRHRFSYYHDQMEAARLALKAMSLLKAERLKGNFWIDPAVDPAQTGLIGPMLTPVTSEKGDLEAKQAALNPNFAAAIVHLLKNAGVKKGDAVGVGCTGSFPGMNIAVFSALQVLNLKPIVISSTSTSEWGATDPNFLWIDMERVLFNARLISFRSAAASLGGYDDMGGGLPSRGRQLLKEGIQRNGLTLLESKNLRESIALHMRTYMSHASPIMAYINVGGGMTSVGGRKGRQMFKTGLNRHPPEKKERSDSVMLRFVSQNVPVIHLLDVHLLARQYGLDDQFTTVPPAGDGEVYFREWYNVWLAAAVLAVILITLYIFFRSDWGFRILQSPDSKKEDSPPEQMV